MNIRTLILSVVLVVIFTLTAGLVLVKTEFFSEASSNAAASEMQEQSVNPNEPSSAPLYRSQSGECFDVPIKDLEACRDTGQMPVQAYQSPIDDCFDVSIGEIASCRNASLEPAP
jgi:ABC-type cobalt transport system substrate-binding protein